MYKSCSGAGENNEKYLLEGYCHNQKVAIQKLDGKGCQKYFTKKSLKMGDRSVT